MVSLLEPMSIASGSFLVLRKDQREFFGKLRSTTAISDIAEHRLWSSGNFTHSFSIVMGLGPQFCISGVSYGHTINVYNIVKERHPSKISIS